MVAARQGSRPHDVRRDQQSAVGHRGHHPHDLQRRGRQRALTDGHRLRVGRVPAMALELADRVGRRHDAAGLARQIDARGLPKAEPPRPIDQRLRRQFFRMMEEIDVAAFGQGLGQRDVAVARAVANIDLRTAAGRAASSIPGSRTSPPDRARPIPAGRRP